MSGHGHRHPRTIPQGTCTGDPDVDKKFRELRHLLPRSADYGVEGNRFGTGAGTIGAAATPVDWTEILPANGDDEAEEPPWLESIGTAITVREAGTYLVSWSISWSSGSSAYGVSAVGDIEWDEAVTYLHVRSAKSGEDTQVGGKSHAIEVHEAKSSLVFPATAIYLYSGDAVLAMVEKVAAVNRNASDGDWTISSDSWLNLIAF